MGSSADALALLDRMKGSRHTDRETVQEQTGVLSQDRLTFGILDRQEDVAAQEQALLG